MTVEERFERMELLIAGFAERKEDGEEDRELWRDTQRQIAELFARVNDLAFNLAETNDTVARLSEETKKNIDAVARESRDADKRLEQRIESLVSPWVSSSSGLHSRSGQTDVGV